MLAEDPRSPVGERRMGMPIHAIIPLNVSNRSKTLKARYKYRIYPNHIQVTKLNQLFGCCRYVWNQSLAHCNQLYINDQKKPSYVDLTKQFITQACARITLVKRCSLYSITTGFKRFRPGI